MPLTRWKIHILYASMSLILSCTLIPKDGKLALLSRNTFKAGTYHWIRRSLRCWWCYLVSTYVWLLQPHGRQPTRLLCPWYFPGRNTGVGCHFLLPGILPTQGSNLHLLHWEADSSPLSHLGSPIRCLCVHKQQSWLKGIKGICTL